MASVAAMTHRDEIGNRARVGFNRSLHVAKEKLLAAGGPVFIGQTLTDIPATVIAQEDVGSIFVLPSRFRGHEPSQAS